MLSVVEQRAGRWGALAATTSAAETQQVGAGEEQYDASSPVYNYSNLSGGQQSPVDTTGYNLPSVSTSRNNFSESA